jgi:hypothetical protein
MPQALETLDEVIERCALSSGELGAVGQLLVQERQRMNPEPDPERLAEVRRQIRALKAAEHPVVRLVFPEGPHEHKLAYRPWADVPEPAKLSMLQDLVDWSGVSNKSMATILLGELDVGKLTSGQRDLLIRLAEPEPAMRNGKMSLEELKQSANGRQPGQVKSKDRGMER